MEEVVRREKRSVIGSSVVKFGKVVNEFDYLTALSNRRLSSQNLGIRGALAWSIDRITIVGEVRVFERKNLDGSISLVDFANVFSIFSDKGLAEPAGKGWVLKDEYGENIVYAEELQYQKGKARVDFNPNRLGTFLDSDLKTFFHKIFINPKFSRADVACDIIDVPDEYISQYKIISDVKSVAYLGRSGKLESIYWGSRSSERQVRLYNKYLEQSKKGGVIHKDIKTWWRLEMQLRRDKAVDWSVIVQETLKQFSSPYFIPLDFSATDKVMLAGLYAEPSLWGQISKNTRTKYKGLVKELREEDGLALALQESFEENQRKLKVELDTWLIGMDILDK